MFWYSAFMHNELHALAHPQLLSWMVVPQAGSAAGTEGFSKTGIHQEMVQATDSSVFLMAQLVLSQQTQQDSQGSPDPIRKRLNCASWFPFMSLLPVVLITRDSYLQGFLSPTPVMQLVSAPAGSAPLEPPMLLTLCACHWTCSVVLGKIDRGQ